jgi:hypothetical protein
MKRITRYWIIALTAQLSFANSAIAEEETMSGAKAIFDSGYGPQISTSGEPAEPVARKAEARQIAVPRYTSQKREIPSCQVPDDCKACEWV